MDAWASWRRLAFGVERLCDLSARVDLEFAVGVRQVGFNGAWSEEQRLGDLSVRRAPGGELRHAELADGECVAPVDPFAAWTGASRVELLASTRGERLGAAPRGQIERLPKRLLCLTTAAGAP